MGSIKLRRLSNKLSYKMYLINLGGKLLLFFSVMILICCLHTYNKNLRPVLNELGASRASQIGQNVVNKSIETVFAQQDALKNDIIDIIRDDNGKITAVVPNMTAMNKLKAEISVEIAHRLSQTKNSMISIPLGNATGISYFSNLGPLITFNLIPYGKTQIDFKTSFTQAGINQTRHEVRVAVTLSVALLISNRQTTTAKITTTVPVSETVIVGDVPESYTNFITSEENSRDDAVNMLD